MTRFAIDIDPERVKINDGYVDMIIDTTEFYEFVLMIQAAAEVAASIMVLSGAVERAEKQS